MVLTSGAIRAMGVATDARIRFGEEEKAEGAWAGRATETVSLAEVENHLAEGLEGLDEEVISTFASLLPAGE